MICVDDTVIVFEVLNRGTANQGKATVVGHWAGGDSAYKPTREIVWPGGVTPDHAARVIRVLVPLPLFWRGGRGKVRRSVILHSDIVFIYLPYQLRPPTTPLTRSM